MCLDRFLSRQLLHVKRIRYDIKNKRRREKNTKEEEREEINMAEQIPRETQARITMKRPGLIAINQTIGWWLDSPRDFQQRFIMKTRIKLQMLNYDYNNKDLWSFGYFPKLEHLNLSFTKNYEGCICNVNLMWN